MSDAPARRTQMRAAFEAIALPNFARPSADHVADHWQTWQEAWEAAVHAERARIVAALPGGHSVDPQWVADMVRDGADDDDHLRRQIQRMADEIERLRAQITDAEILATYGRDDGWREWVSVGTWLHPGDRIVALRCEECDDD